jgi:DNA-directed RNA polymerase subunit RPC12/RpoP
MSNCLSIEDISCHNCGSKEIKAHELEDDKIEFACYDCMTKFLVSPEDYGMDEEWNGCLEHSI